MNGFKTKSMNVLRFLPGFIILVVGMVALHTSVKLSTQHDMLEQYHATISAQYESFTGREDSVEVRRTQMLSQKVRVLESRLYWAVIAISLTAFLLLILNAHRQRQVETMGSDKQEALKLLQQRLAAIEASFEGIGIVDSDGNLSYMNPALMALHGISVEKRQEYIGEPWLKLYTRKGQDEVLKTVLPEFEEQGFWQGKSKLLRHDGDTIWAALSMTRLDDGGFIGTARDITEQEKVETEKKEIRDQLFQAQKMEAVGRLAGGIAHDFNNILAAMNGNAEFLSEDLEEGSETHKFALNILQAGSQARILVDSILTFSRRQDGQIDPIDLFTPLQESISMLRATLPKTVEVETELSLKQARIDANATQLSQMIMNICVNARDAMEQDKGKIRISLSQPDLMEDVPVILLQNDLPNPQEEPAIRIEAGAPGQTKMYLGAFSKNSDYAHLSISDTGTGMSQVVMEKIFEPFFTTKDMHKGTGLGLSSVHGTIAAHRGALIIDSIVGQGTCFNLYFPMSVSKENKDPIQEGVAHKGSGEMVLLVDDQPEVLEMASVMLQRLGYKVEAVLSGFEALDLLRENPEKFDLVITDQNMPKMTGLELVEQTHCDFPDLPFILISGYSKESLEEMMEGNSAIKAVLRKPLSQKVFGNKIAQILMNSTDQKSAVA